MSKVAHYLQEHLLGEVTASPEVRRHFAYDASVLRLAPAIVVYPRNENDVRKTARFAWQLAKRGRPMPITARGGGSDTSGAAIGSGIVLVFPAHMNRILTLDPRKEFTTVEPGATYDKLEQTLFTHGLFLPPYPASQNYATIGGGIANNAIGEKSAKYGSTGNYVEQLRVVLANGEVIETGHLSKRDLNRKLGLSTFEGEIYRALDTLLEENSKIIEHEKQMTKSFRNATGYNLSAVKTKDGFNLTPLIVGSKGTLGIITEATLEVLPYNPSVYSALASIPDLNDLQEVLTQIIKLKPSVCDMINRPAIEEVTKINPNQLKGLMERPDAAIHLFVEFDDQKGSIQKKDLKELKKIIEKFGGACQIAETPDEQDRLRKVRQSVSTILNSPHGQAKSVPVAEDVCVPVDRLEKFLKLATDIYRSFNLAPVVWGNASDGVVRMQPVLDLGQLGDRQRLFKLSEAIYRAALEVEGSLTAAAGDGRVRAPYLSLQYGPEYNELLIKVKKIFDPYNILNPGVKTANLEQVKALIRGDYNLEHRHEHLPRS
jgi:FAD/FMN-containing dehydrogenase